MNANVNIRPSSSYLASQLTGIARESTRDTARLTVSLSQDVIDSLNNDSSARIMVFCASETIGPYSRDASDIAFPHNVELKCNGDEVKANLRGLKNRPGSTRPADITSMMRIKPANYPNSVEMVYALTTKVSQHFQLSALISFIANLTLRIIYAEQGKSNAQKFYLVVNLVSKNSIDAMVSQIRHGRMISKVQVVRESTYSRPIPLVFVTYRDSAKKGRRS